MFRLVRYWSRRWAPAGPAQHVPLLEAVDAAAGDDGTARIQAVATQLGLDRSNASRMLTAAVEAGFVTKTVPAHDARRTSLSLTPAGAAVLESAHAWQEETFARLTAGWSRTDVRRLASYLVRLAAQPDPEATS